MKLGNCGTSLEGENIRAALGHQEHSHRHRERGEGY